MQFGTAAYGRKLIKEIHVKIRLLATSFTVRVVPTVSFVDVTAVKQIHALLWIGPASRGKRPDVSLESSFAIIAKGYRLDDWSSIPSRGEIFFFTPQHPDLL
jgi:hypothetical protein